MVEIYVIDQRHAERMWAEALDIVTDPENSTPSQLKWAWAIIRTKRTTHQPGSAATGPNHQPEHPK